MSGEPGPPRGDVSDDELWQFVAHSYSAFQRQTHPRLGIAYGTIKTARE